MPANLSATHHLVSSDIYELWRELPR